MRTAAIVATILVNLLAIVFLWPSDAAERPATVRRGDGKKVFVLGCDGLDAGRIERLLAEGRLPHMAKLAEQGGFTPLKTSIPPQSPVAWSNFITGAGPGVHGIFDFIHRSFDPNHPEHGPRPYFSTNQFLPKKGWSLADMVPETVHVPKTDYNVVLRSGSENTLLRRGKPFWDYLDRRGIKVDMYRLPANYPPTKSSKGNVRVLPGMGVPDAVEVGTQGTYQHFSTKPRREVDRGGGYKARLRRNLESGAYEGTLRGPSNQFLLKRKANPEHGAEEQESEPELEQEQLEVPFRVFRDPERDTARITWENVTLAGTEAVDVVLNVGGWSDWVEVVFPQTGAGYPEVRTMTRLLLQSVRPHVEVYFTPLNFTPESAPPDFSEPAGFIGDIGDEIGPFYTQGFAEDFKARDHNVLTDAEFQAQAELVFAERTRLLDYALDHYVDGLLFFYFSSSDLQAHIYWWDAAGQEHPIRSWEEAQKYDHVIDEIYMRLDDALGRCLERLGEDVTVIVMSDHGFGNFGRQFGLTTWLREEGYLAAERGLLIDCDWSQTRAYGLGLNGLYLNLAGREPAGIVDPADADALLDELCDKLLAVRDPLNGKPVIKTCYKTKDWYHGDEAKNAPDIIVGYAAGYRSSWGTALGDFDRDVVIANKSAWSADHCVAHDLVPGILIANKPILRDDPALIDLAPTILAEFGVAEPEQMTGRPLFGE